MRDIGLQAQPPKTVCDDPHCPFHSGFPVRTKVIEGKVVSSKMGKTVIVQRDYVHYIPKYLRYERRHSRTPAHNPPCILAKEGDAVKMAECRPIGKTVSFVIIEKSSQSEK